MQTLVIPQPRSFKISDRPLPPEGYRLRIDNEGHAAVEANDAAGRFYAEVTLSQLNGCKGPLEIEDWPSYKWRGVLLDEGRHFFGKAAVKSILDKMARFKLNVFHWHLTEDQGWRLDLPGIPELARIGSVRPSSWKVHTENVSDGVQYGPFFYSPDDVREILAYAAERHIRVIPEIEIPGHIQALLAAHPEFTCESLADKPSTPLTVTGVNECVLCVGNDEAIAYLEKVFDAVMALFPDEVIHLGGDECPRRYWKTCPKCQARVREEHLGDENDLQAWVTRHFADYLKAHGRRAIGWDEILEGGLAEGVLVQSWRTPANYGADGESPTLRAARAGHEVVASPWCRTYFSAPASREDKATYRLPVDKYPEKAIISLRDAYAFDPCEGLPEELKRFVVGSESCNWTEGTRDVATLEAKMWPRTAAFAEAMWTGEERGDFDDFTRRLEAAVR